MLLVLVHKEDTTKWWTFSSENFNLYRSITDIIDGMMNVLLNPASDMATSESIKSVTVEKNLSLKLYFAII